MGRFNNKGEFLFTKITLRRMRHLTAVSLRFFWNVVTLNTRVGDSSGAAAPALLVLELSAVGGGSGWPN